MQYSNTASLGQETGSSRPGEIGARAPLLSFLEIRERIEIGGKGRYRHSGIGAADRRAAELP